jgi:hypothetical protein
MSTGGNTFDALQRLSAGRRCVFDCGAGRPGITGNAIG